MLCGGFILSVSILEYMRYAKATVGTPSGMHICPEK